MYSALLPLSKYLEKKDSIRNAWNIEIRDIDYGKDYRHIEIKAVDAHKSYPEIIPWKNEYLSGKDFVLKLGRGDFEEVSINLQQYPHVLLASGSGGGKSSLLNVLLIQAYQKGEIGIVDMKGGLDYGMWAEKCPIITTPEECLAYLNELIHIMNERINLLIKAKVPNMEKYNSQESSPLSRILIIFDEIADILGVKPKDKKTKELFESIEECINLLARKSRAVGLHMILCYQRPSATSLNGDIKLNLGHRICGICDSIMSDMVLCNNDAFEMIPQNSKGFFVYNMGGLFKAYYYDITSDNSFVENV